MTTPRINLLPAARIRAHTREYYFRLAAVALSLGTALVLVAAVLLISTYAFLVADLKSKEALVGGPLPSRTSEGAAFANRLTLLSKNVARIVELKDAPSAAALVSDALAIPHLGVRLSGVTYLLDRATKERTLLFSGIASTRDALRTYQLALQKASFAKSVDLPVSAYAKDVDIPFSITISLGV